MNTSEKYSRADSWSIYNFMFFFYVVTGQQSSRPSKKKTVKKIEELYEKSTMM